jgi:uncharacterized protein involved in exopolysaccharide biosynthesis
MTTNQKLDLVDHLSLIFRRRKSIIVHSFICCIVAAIVSLTLPYWYTAETTILPPTDDNSDISLSSLLNKIPLGGLGMGLGAASEEATLLLAILNSRTLMESTVQQFNLKERYRCKNMEESIKELRKHISVKLNEEGTITVKASAKTGFLPGRKSIEEARRLSMDISNFCIQELDRINKTLKTERATNTRKFIEKRYMQNIKDLSDAEERLKNFQQKSGAIDLPTQTSSVIKAVAEVKAKIMVKEINLNVLKESYGQSNMEAVTLQNELTELRKKYLELLNNSGEIRGDAKDPFLPIKDLPRIGIEYARIYRDVVMQQTIMEFLLPQFEQAKIQEAKDTPTVQVLDPAVLPIKRSKPKRAFFVLLVAFIVTGFGVVHAEWQEHMINLRELKTEQYRKIDIIRSGIHNDLKKFFRRGK